MTKILKSIHKTELKFDAAAKQFFSRHPVLEYAAVFIGLPLFLLTAVFACSAALILPLALLSGWI